MRVLFLTLKFARVGGLETYNLDLVRALQNAGCDVLVWSVFDQQSTATDGIEARPLAPQNRLAMSLYCRFFWANLLRQRFTAVASEYDLAIFAHVNMLPAVYEASVRAGLPYWVWTYGIEVWADWSPKIRSGLKAAQLIGTVSTYTKLSISRRLPDARVVVVPPAVDVARFVPVQEIKNTDEPATLLTVGRLERDKGHEVVMRSLPLIVRRVERPVLYLIAGAGSDRSRLERLGHEYEVADWVEFLGRVPDQQLAQLYQSCDVFVMPSRGEGFGIVYAEAAACGKPVIASNQGGATDAVIHGVTGFAVDPTSVEAVAEAACILLGDPDLARQMGEAGRRFVVENFSLEAFERRVVALLAESGLRTRLGQHHRVGLPHQEGAR